MLKNNSGIPGASQLESRPCPPERTPSGRRFLCPAELCYPKPAEGDPEMAKIYYVGDWAVLTGPVFAETPFYSLSTRASTSSTTGTG
ncbi:MAG: hypothetical protein MZV64_34150 [Ignavibacteriales bacterium]|nr:hypothetical protein [Ignavibacteriales bacterium]